MADSGTYDQGTITRRQKIAEQMLAESSKPQQIRHWAQGLAQLGNVGADAFALNRLDKQAKEGRAADTAALMGILDTGGQAPTAPQSAPISAPAPPSDAGGAIAGIESGGRYDALGPVTKTGDRAYGKYQVMGANIPEWTKAHGRREMTPQEFVASPEAQDAVFKGQFGQYANKYGNEGAARAWFAGEGGMNDPGRRDQLGTSVADYSKKFTDATGPQAIARAMTPPVGDTGGPAKPDAQGVYGPDATMMPPATAPASPAGPAAVAQAMTGAPGAGQPPAPAAAPLAAQNAPQGIPDQQRAAIARLMSATPGSPAYQLGLQLAGQALKPKDYGFQTLPDGTILRTDPHQGTATPIYQGAHKYTYQTLPDGTILQVDPLGKEAPKPVYSAPLKPELKDTGTDPVTGRKTYESYDPKTNSWMPINRPGAAAGSSPPQSGTLAKGVSEIDHTLVGPAYIQQFSPEVQAAVKTWMESGTQPTGSPRNNAMAGIIRTIGPKVAQDMGVPMSELEAKWTAHRKMQSDLASSGNSSMGGILSNGQSAFLHLANLGDKFSDLGNYSGPDVMGGGHVGTIGNVIGNQVLPTPETKGKITGMTTNALRYGQEATKFYAGSGGGVEERLQALKEHASPSATATQQASFLETEKELMLGRLKEKTDQIRNVMGADYIAKHPEYSVENNKDLQKEIARVDANIARLRGAQKPEATPGTPAEAPPKVRKYNPATGKIE